MHDEFWTHPHSTFEARRRAFLEFATAGAQRGRTGFFSQLARLELGQGPIDESAIRDAVAYVDARHDCSDFTVAGLLRLLYQYADSPLLSPELVETIRSTVLNFKYWIDEPGQEMMCFWSENHQIMFHAAEYLAGQLLADELFPNVGRNGRWHMDKARPKILRWIDFKARLGFSEWDSNCYYDEDMTPLLNLADFAEDEEIAQKAAMLLDVMFFDMAVDSFRGVYGTSHGRTYPTHVLSGRTDAMAGVQKIVWGMGVFNNPSNMTAVSLATSRRYRLPSIIEAIAQDMPTELINRERHSFEIEDASRYGLSFHHLDTAMIAWGAGLFATRAGVEGTLKLADRFHSQRFNVVIRPYTEAVSATYQHLETEDIPHEGDLDRTSMTQVNKITYRTPDYQLSSAQDYRAGKLGFQQHIWQATLGPDAIVFAFHRGNEDEESYKYWVGRFPRVGQYKNLLIAIHNTPAEPLPGPKTILPPEAGGNAMPSPAPSEEALLPYTVAVFPRSAFDEVVEKNDWIFARKDEGYLALRSSQPTRWTSNGVLRGEGLIADGRQNVWICQLGRAKVDGPFEAWRDRIAKASVDFGEMSVVYRAPGLGYVRYAWTGDFIVGGQTVSQRQYRRFDNPYCQAEFGSGYYNIQHANKRLIIDFEAGSREIIDEDQSAAA